MTIERAKASFNVVDVMCDALKFGLSPFYPTRGSVVRRSFGHDRRGKERKSRISQRSFATEYISAGFERSALLPSRCLCTFNPNPLPRRESPVQKTSLATSPYLYNILNQDWRYLSSIKSYKRSLFLTPLFFLNETRLVSAPVIPVIPAEKVKIRKKPLVSSRKAHDQSDKTVGASHWQEGYQLWIL